MAKTVEILIFICNLNKNTSPTLYVYEQKTLNCYKQYHLILLPFDATYFVYFYYWKTALHDYKNYIISRSIEA